MAKKVDEFPVYARVSELAVAITAILNRPGMRRDLKLRAQISDAIDSVAANMEEGFEQGTDRAFAHYLTIAKGSVGEIIGHLRRASRKGYIQAEELSGLVARLEEIGRMLGGFIKYLERSDFKDRGRHRIPDP
ncbi:MAG TPA: four helix bundle protein [Vicinamibacterales bacterium]|nr:four helix bundle protein [Vicinamibacterales bacterium]